MDKNTRICKICGKEYPYCTTITNTVGNRWQDVGCCIEHATEYFKKVAIARGELVEEEPLKKEIKSVPKYKKQVETQDSFNLADEVINIERALKVKDDENEETKSR